MVQFWEEELETVDERAVFVQLRGGGTGDCTKDVRFECEEPLRKDKRSIFVMENLDPRRREFWKCGWARSGKHFGTMKFYISKFGKRKKLGGRIRRGGAQCSPRGVYMDNQFHGNQSDAVKTPSPKEGAV